MLPVFPPILIFNAMALEICRNSFVSFSKVNQDFPYIFITGSLNAAASLLQ